MKGHQVDLACTQVFLFISGMHMDLFMFIMQHVFVVYLVHVTIIRLVNNDRNFLQKIYQSHATSINGKKYLQKFLSSVKNK